MARVVIPGLPHHIVNRGNRRQDVFFRESDYYFYLEMLSLFSRIYEVRIISYCLMTNHIHLIAIPVGIDGLAKMMKDVQKSYTRMINFRKQWSGCLWQGRFFSSPMDDLYTAQTARYIELNPVKANIVGDFANYPYSSAAFHVGLRDQDPVIKAPYFDFDGPAWRTFVEEGMDYDDVSFIEQKTQTGRPMGDQAFVQKLENITGRTLHPQKRGPK